MDKENENKMTTKIEIEPKRPEEFLKLIRHATRFNVEPALFFEESGIRIREWDPSQVSLIDIFMPKEYFKTFKTKETGVRVDPIDIINIDTDFLLPHKLKITIENKKCTFRFDETAFTVDIEDHPKPSDIIPLPTLVPQLPSQIGISATWFNKALKAHESTSEYITLKTTTRNNKVDLISTSDRSRTISSHQSSVLSKTDAASQFSNEMLQRILKGTEDTTMLTINLGNNVPVKIRYRIGKTEITNWIAPRINP